MAGWRAGWLLASRGASCPARHPGSRNSTYLPAHLACLVYTPFPLCREGRHPFLDEGVIAAVLQAPLHHIADLRLPPGEGDKAALRACLRRLGLPRAAARVKRAIQFGSRLAAKSNAAAFGGTRRANHQNAGSVRLSAVPLLASPAAPAVVAPA